MFAEYEGHNNKKNEIPQKEKQLQGKILENIACVNTMSQTIIFHTQIMSFNAVLHFFQNV